MIPLEILNSFKVNGITYQRKDIDHAIKILNKLGLDQKEQIFEYYSTVYGGNIINPKCLDEMIDIADEEIFETLEYVQERYKLSTDFIPLTSDESEGMYLYNKKNKKVYDFSLDKYNDFISNAKPRWDNFYDFLLWYIDSSLD